MIGFLLDENVEPAFRVQLAEYEPTLRLYWVGDGVAPPRSTLDPDLLLWIEEHDCILLTYNRSSMPVHLRNHIKANHHILGIVQLNPRISVGEMIADLLLIWGASLPDEFQDRIIYLPL